MKVMVIEPKEISIKQYLEKFKPHFKDIINNLNKYDTWKI